MPRAMFGVASLLPAWRRLQSAPRGDGRPVLLLPGLINTDHALAVMRRYLNGIGYHAVGWGLGRNLGLRAIGADGAKLLARVTALHEETGRPVTLIGVSLGGIMARFAAHRLPDCVDQVITIAAPYAGHPRATRVLRAYERWTGERIDDALSVALREEIARPLPVPATALWSRSDGLVNGYICHAPDEQGCRAIEVRSGHMGVQFQPDVLRIVADVLAGRRV